jgi:hypothetical protein
MAKFNVFVVYIKKLSVLYSGAPGGAGRRAAAAQHPPKPNLKNTYFVDIIISKVFRDLPSAEIRHLSRLMTSTLEF